MHETYSKCNEWLTIWLLLQHEVYQGVLRKIGDKVHEENTTSKKFLVSNFNIFQNGWWKAYDGEISWSRKDPESFYFGLRHNCVRELITNGVITIDCMKSSQNLTDPFTEGLPWELVNKTSKGMSLKPMNDRNSTQCLTLR